LISGDFLSYSYVDDREAWLAARQVLSEVDAPLGVFAVSGSPPVDSDEALQFIFEGTRVRWLKDELVTFSHGPNEIALLGISCTHKPFLDAPRLEALRRGEDTRFTVLLYHSPDLAPEAASLGIDLQLSGHTHGGQVRLPFFGALYPSSLYGKQLEVGRRQIGAMTLYVTRGLGLEGKGAPRVRFLSPPELVVWEISGP
jgi:predicted MPP superfamily phosphohydrolase